MEFTIKLNHYFIYNRNQTYLQLHYTCTTLKNYHLVLEFLHTCILTIAYKFWKPLTRVGTFENFWLNASDMLWAGSVEIMSTLSRTFASWVAKQQLQGSVWKIYLFCFHYVTYPTGLMPFFGYLTVFFKGHLCRCFPPYLIAIYSM